MKCKYCFAELPDDATICPLCGKELIEEEPAEKTVTEEIEEETEEIVEEEVEEIEDNEEYEDDDDEHEEIVIRRKKKKKKPMPKWLMPTLVSAVAVLLTVGLAVAVLVGMGLRLSNISAFFGFAEAGIDYKNNYSVSDRKMEKNANTVIAQLGNQALTNEQLQVYYWTAVREYIYQYNYALALGQSVELDFDPAKPLNQQVYDPVTGKSWQRFFLEAALGQWQNYATIVQLAEDDGYVLSQEIQDFLDTYDEEMTATALEAGLADVETLIDEQISKGSSAAAHYHTFKLEYTALGYLDNLDKDWTPSEKEVNDYYEAHEKEMTANGTGKDAGKYYDVRHIFVTVNGEMGQLEDGTYGYTEEQWEECYNRAKKILDDFLANAPTEEKFAELAKEKSQDTGSASNGGLYSYLTKDYGFVKEFEDWYVDESRKPGDTGIVKNTGSTKVGYHVMYFSSSKEIWRDEAETQVVNAKMTNLLTEAKAKYPMTVNYKKLVLGKATLVDESATTPTTGK